MSPGIEKAFRRFEVMISPNGIEKGGLEEVEELATYRTIDSDKEEAGKAAEVGSKLKFRSKFAHKMM